ncbi:MAG: RluA family pseudouridine synthase [Candidatus Omnitrophota bacterium]
MEKTEQFCFTVTDEDQGLRLDCYLQKKITLELSRSRLQSLIKAAKVTLNSQAVKPGHKVRSGDIINVDIPPDAPVQAQAENIPIDLVFEDEDILVVNKPAGMVTHPGVGNNTHTLVNALLHYGCTLSSVNGPLRPGIVHRLDKDTSGLMVIAKNDRAHHRLSRQFQKHNVERRYIAIVKGKVEHDEGVIDAPLARDPLHRKQFVVGLHNSRDALTRFKVVKRYSQLSLVELTPYTGRTHQLRVHLKFLGHPILGDERYGKRGEFSRMALHATGLGFRHPLTKEMVRFSSEIPADFTRYLDSLK